MNKHNKTETVIDTENKQVREMKRYKLLVTKSMSHRYEMCSVGNTVRNNGISLYGDRRQLDLVW